MTALPPSWPLHRAVRSGPAPTLLEVLHDVEHRVVSGPGDLRIEGLTDDPRRAGPGDLLLALPGTDASLAWTAASAIVRERGAEIRAATSVEVADIRRVAAAIAARYFGYHLGHGADELEIVGVTGTNGKTTTASMIATMLASAGCQVSECGTLGARVGDERFEFPLTFPEACTWHALLARARVHGCRTMVCEVTSESVIDHRLSGTRLAVAAYTNLSRDHLDVHESMAAYAGAKAAIFAGLEPGAVAVLNADDPACRELSTPARVLRFGLEDARADVRVRGLRLERECSRGLLLTPSGTAELDLAVPGRFNVRNALAAAAVGVALGISPDSIAAGLARFEGVPGRLQRLANPFGLDIRVDYAHTPDALEQLLSSMRELAPRRRILLVFGCGGERDSGKRPLMGKVACRWADQVIITSDNPRSESPTAILADIARGADRSALAIVDRREAIAVGLGMVGPGDLLLIAGKGHELTQEQDGQLLPFDDREVVRELLALIDVQASCGS